MQESLYLEYGTSQLASEFGRKVIDSLLEEGCPCYGFYIDMLIIQPGKAKE